MKEILVPAETAPRAPPQCMCCSAGVGVANRNLGGPGGLERLLQGPSAKASLLRPGPSGRSSIVMQGGGAHTTRPLDPRPHVYCAVGFRHPKWGGCTVPMGQFLT